MRHRPDVEEIFRQEMLKLRSEYIAHSLTQVEAMRSLLQPHESVRLRTEALTQLITLAHRLRGSGQTYDLSEVTDWASILEDDLRSIERNRGRLTVERRRSLLSVLDQLRSILEAEQDKDRESKIEDRG